MLQVLCCILQLLYIFSINYKCFTKNKRLERREGSETRRRWCRHGGDAIFAYFWTSFRRGAINPSILWSAGPRPAVKRVPVAVEGGERAALRGERRRSYYVSSITISGSKSCKFLGISSIPTSMMSYLECFLSFRLYTNCSRTHWH